MSLTLTTQSGWREVVLDIQSDVVDKSVRLVKELFRHERYEVLLDGLILLYCSRAEGAMLKLAVNPPILAILVERCAQWQLREFGGRGHEHGW